MPAHTTALALTSLLGGALVGVVPGGLANHGGPLVGTARQAVEAQCRAAVLRVGDARAASLELPADAKGGRSTSSAAVAVPVVRGVTEWADGPVPGRFVAVLDATRSGRALRIRATVDVRGGACRLVSWRVV